VGGATKRVENIIKLVEFVSEASSRKTEFYMWVTSETQISTNTTFRKHIGFAYELGIIEGEERVTLGPTGQRILSAGADSTAEVGDILFAALYGTVQGYDYLLTTLLETPIEKSERAEVLSNGSMNRDYSEKVAMKHYTWLKAIGYVTEEAGRYELTQRGRDVAESVKEGTFDDELLQSLPQQRPESVVPESKKLGARGDDNKSESPEPANAFVVGERYRDARDPEEDQFKSWIRGPLKTGISSMGGIRVVNGEESPLKGEIACVVLISSELDRNEGDDRWDDEFDLDHGRIEYWGDAKRDDPDEVVDEDSFAGNRQLREVHRRRKGDRRKRYPPILVFRKPEKGIVEFSGLAVIDQVELDEFIDQGVPTPNYRFSLDVLDVSTVNLDWLYDFYESGTHDAAPEAWQEWIETGEVSPEIQYGDPLTESPADLPRSPPVIFGDGDSSRTEITSTTTEVRISDRFKAKVREAYDHRCVVSGIEKSELLTVSHVVGRAESKKDAQDEGNVLLMDWLHHYAFDAGYYTWDEEYRLQVNPDFEPASPLLQTSIVDREGEQFTALVEGPVESEFLRRRNEQLQWM
jgi:hypothetical protein